MSQFNEARSFVLEERGIRGCLVRLHETWANITANHDYTPPVRDVLGRGIALTVMMAMGLKGKPKVALQMRGSGPVSMLVVQCSRELRVRGMAHWRQAGADEPILGEGHISVMLDASDERGMFQGIVPMVSDEIDTCLEAYFRQSEQLPTQLVTLANDRYVAGLMLQTLPGHEDAAEQMEEAATGARLVAEGGLHDQDAESLLPTMFPTETIRLFPSRTVLQDCRCTPEHLAGIARMLGPDELQSILDERGNVQLTCEFCNRRFNYGPGDVTTILEGGTPPASFH